MESRKMPVDEIVDDQQLDDEVAYGLNLVLGIANLASGHKEHADVHLEIAHQRRQRWKGGSQKGEVVQLSAAHHKAD